LESWPEDIELIERLQKGDVEAFDIVFSKYSGKLYKFGFKYLRSKTDSEELVQSVFMKVWEGHSKLRKELSFNSYLFTIAYNDICKLFRRRNYLQKFLSDTLAENPELSHRIEDRIDFQSVLDRVKQIINIMPDRQKTIFIKSREEGKSSKEIASELGISTGTVDNYISEALRFIRNRLKSEDLALFLFLSLFLF
jgi:RNA polymerase sigma-70 factor (ECF subfamily)